MAASNDSNDTRARALETNPFLASCIKGDPVGVQRYDGIFIPFRFDRIDEAGRVYLTAVVKDGSPMHATAIHWKDVGSISPAAECTFGQRCDVCQGRGDVLVRIPGSEESESQQCGHCHGRRFVSWDPFANEPHV